jgi:hypothetical protein
MGKTCSKTVSSFKQSPSAALDAEEGEGVLYVILPFFNYCRFERRTQLFLEFVARIKDNPHIRIVVVEAGSGNAFQLPRKIPGVHLHLGYNCPSKLWIKENLINLAIRRLPKNWKYVAWVDADITFMNDTWAQDTIAKLVHEFDVVQIFQTCVNLGPLEEALKIDRSFGYMYRDNGHTYHPTAKYGFWHPGFAWACTRWAYDTVGGLVDWGILGSGDRHMALALIGHVEGSYPGGIHESYKRKLRAYQEKARHLRLGWVKGTILHHWHGRLEDRKYQERWNILTKEQYDPDVDVRYDSEGLLQLTPEGKRLEPQLIDYFVGRREDHMRVTA